ncbi:MAG: bile acid:sodium symporter family protein [Chitinophagales bacterium]
MPAIDELHINFNRQGLLLLNIILALVMFGIALDLRKEDFLNLWRNKKSALAGLVAHFILLPLLTYTLVIVLKPSPSIALGMILVGACPGGNMSNMFTHMAKGNTALAVGLTSVSHFLAIILTPLNFSFYGSLNADTNALLHKIHLDFAEVLQTVGIVVILPIVAGVLLTTYKVGIAQPLHKWMKKFALLAFAFFLVAAFASNFSVFVATAGIILPLVVVHNAVALSAGYLFAKTLKLPEVDCRTITFETGVQNSGLGLILIFSFFNGLGGMALIAACWGVWHLISGGLLSFIWGRTAINPVLETRE